jgi:hypothetical protein
MYCKSIRYPIYIVSKGRADTSLTARCLEKENIDFLVAVEPQEYDEYARALGTNRVLKLPFENLGVGSFPARNYCWEHSIKNGFTKHFLFDDNIYGFCRLNNGTRKKCTARESLVTLQDFTDRYVNIGMSGFNYRYFVCKETKKPFFLNTHVYSGMLINNQVPFRWRLKYNEDVDLNLQLLHNKWCTVLLNAFLINKVSTSTKMKGGNQTELYQNNDEGKKALKSSSLKSVWPQYVDVIRRFGRPHHHVAWNKHFKHPLKRKISE